MKCDTSHKTGWSGSICEGGSEIVGCGREAVGLVWLFEGGGGSGGRLGMGLLKR